MQLNGLNNKEVEKRKQDGQINVMPKVEIKSNWEIIKEHSFTLFNLYSFIIAGALLYVKAYSSLLFIFVMISNTIMFIIQEIRARDLIKELNIVIAPHTKVIRNGSLQSIPNEEIVLDDIVFLEAGQQISADATIIDGGIEVNEALLTGEIEPVEKTVNDSLLSGSFVVSGICYAQVKHVGEENYAIKVTQTIRSKRANASELLTTFKKVTKITSLFVIPIGSILLYQSLVMRNASLKDSFVNTSTALLGMLPQGLVLLTTMSLIASALKLGSKKTLIQDLYAIETLSQSDVLCLDKTGTLTEGKMSIQSIYQKDPRFSDYMNAFAIYSFDNNATARAIKNHFKGTSNLILENEISFSSARKWSGMNFKNQPSLILGAPEIILNPVDTIPSEILKKGQEGTRILCAAISQHKLEKNIKHKSFTILGFLLIHDPLRSESFEAIQFFQENDVAVKVISGDNIDTVKAIAKQAGINDYQNAIDARELHNFQDYQRAILNHNVIARANPKQKLEFVKALQSNKFKVAMTGDGINDVLALKQANCSIAMGEGSEAALHISQIVIMDGKLSTLVDVVKEGRQVLNHIIRSASMYYLRTILTFFVSFIAILMNVPFPFIPFQITISNMFIDGFPSFMLLFEDNFNKPKENIASHVLKYSVPNATAIIFFWFLLNLFNDQLNIDIATAQTMMYFLNGYISIHMIYRIYKPLNLYRVSVLIINFIGFFAASFVFWPLLEIRKISLLYVKMTIVFALLSHIIVWFVDRGIQTAFREKKKL